MSSGLSSVVVGFGTPPYGTPPKSASYGIEAVTRVLQRPDLGTGRARASWHALGAVHGNSKNALAEQIPNLPCTVTVTADEEEEMQASKPVSGLQERQGGEGQSIPESKGPYSFHFSGAPCPMLPLLKQMVRFKRPFITWDIWNTPPPLAFPGVAGSAAEVHGPTQDKHRGPQANPQDVEGVTPSESRQSQQSASSR